MATNQTICARHVVHTRAGDGPHYLMLGSVTISTLIAGDRTGGQLSVVEFTGVPGSGPGPHVDPWTESFYVLDGEVTFRFEEEGRVQTAVARRGDAVSIPQGVGHAFSVTSATAARALVASTPAGIDAFFADAGERIERPNLPSIPAPFDRDRLHAAIAAHGLGPFSFPT